MKTLQRLKLNFTDLINFICLAFILDVIPIIVRAYNRDGTVDEISVGMARFWDFFSYYKSFFLILVCAVIAFTSVSSFVVGEKKFTKDLFKDRVLCAVLAYGFFVALSAMFSKYPQTAFQGFTGRYEGTFSLLSYGVILLAAKYFVNDKLRARVFFYMLVVSALLVGTVGAFQSFGFDIFKTDFGKNLALGSYANTEGISFSVEFDKTYATLYNPNCAGLYAAFLTPVFFFAGLFLDKKSPLKYVCFFMCALMFACLYGSASVAGYIGFFTSIAASVLVLCVYNVKFGKYKKIFFGGIGLAFVCGLMFVCVNFERVSGFVTHHFNIDGSKYGLFVTDLQMNGERATIETINGNVVVTATSDGYEIANALLVSEKSEEKYFMKAYNIDKIGKVEMYTYDGFDLCQINLRDFSFLFGKNDDGNIAPLELAAPYNPIDLSQKIPSVGFTGLEHLATGRGFIWSRSIPLLKNNIIIGAGPDSFAYQFPQNDILGKIRAGLTPYSIVDKPHNTYLQIANNTGVLSLCALLFVFGYYVFASFKAIISKKRGDDFLFGVSVGLFAGITAYLVCSLSTDSTVSVSPIFYACLGFGLALNKLLD